MAVLDRPLLRSFSSYVILFKWLTLHLSFLNWKSELTSQQLWTTLSMRSRDVEHLPPNSIPPCANTLVQQSTSPLMEVLEKWMMTVSYKSDVETES